MSATSSLPVSSTPALQGSPIAVPVAAPARPAQPAAPARPRVSRIPFLGRLSLQWQSIILLGMLVVSVGVAMSLTMLERRTERIAAIQSEVVGNVLMHSQRLSKAANLAVQGNQEAYTQLMESRAVLAKVAEALLMGGEIGSMRIPPLSDGAQAQGKQFETAWKNVSPSVDALMEQQSVLVRFGALVNEIAQVERELSKAQTTVLNSLRDSGAPAADQLTVTRLHAQSRSIIGEIIRMHSASAYDGGDAVVLARSIENYASIRNAAQNGDASTPAVRNAEARETLRRMKPVADHFITLALEAQKALPALERARDAGMEVFHRSDDLTRQADALRSVVSPERSVRSNTQWTILGFSSAAVLALLLLTKAYYDDSKIQAERSAEKRLEAERLEKEASLLNEKNQAAILRLMNELQNVADGDLTVQATVSDDITGAIADSINYTVEELRSLVGRINRTAAAVAEASASAQVTSSHLQAVSEQQSREIRETGESVLNMAAQIRQVSERASESAQVANQSLSAASRGREAVQNAIAGMGTIREQIQDTAKRIKRLGESSQEIGEIVELISNITEQTNVLALNAAIQAASAGEAGRGFTVVAEEVQRLAERSAEATRQISTLVKAIQTDTHDAVAAMERSTQNVIRGAKLSDEAGMALIGIGKVSQELADLITRISRTTESQAASASSVAQSIQRILLVNSQTNEGTQQTAGSILQLSELARELKNSVARFRVN